MNTDEIVKEFRKGCTNTNIVVPKRRPEECLECLIGALRALLIEGVVDGRKAFLMLTKDDEEA